MKAIEHVANFLLLLHLLQQAFFLQVDYLLVEWIFKNKYRSSSQWSDFTSFFYFFLNFVLFDFVWLCLTLFDCVWLCLIFTCSEGVGWEARKITDLPGLGYSVSVPFLASSWLILSLGPVNTLLLLLFWQRGLKCGRNLNALPLCCAFSFSLSSSICFW